VEELEAGGPGAVDDEVALVGGAVVGRAKQAQDLGVVLAAVGAAVGVMLVKETGVAAAADRAAAAVAAHDLAAHGRGIVWVARGRAGEAGVLDAEGAPTWGAMGSSLCSRAEEADGPWGAGSAPTWG